MTNDLVFAITAAVSVFSAFVVVTRRSPVHSALALVVCLLSIAAIFLQLDGSFIAAIHVMVYAGAIMVLFLFVIMLLNLSPGEFGDERGIAAPIVAGILSLALFILIVFPLLIDKPIPPADIAAEFGTVADVGRTLFSQYILPFELVSILILAVIAGVVVLAKKRAGEE